MCSLHPIRSLLGGFGALLLSVPALAQTATLIQTIDASQFVPPSPDPAGITYLANVDLLLVSDSEVNEMGIYQGVNLFRVTRGGTLVGTANTTSFSNEPTGVSWDPVSGHIFVSDDDADEIEEVDPGPDGVHGTLDDTTWVIDTLTFGSFDPEDVEYDPATHKLYVVDGAGDAVFTILPGPNGVFDSAPPLGDDIVTSFSTIGLGVLDPEGIAFDPVSGDLFIVGRPAAIIDQVTTAGVLVRTIDISAAGAVKPAGLTFAPGSQDPTANHLYIVDRGVDNDYDPSENDGKIYEFRLPDPETPPGDVVLDIRVAAGADDAEERANGSVSRASSDLELVFEPSGNQVVGLRFVGVAVPQGAEIAKASIQFKTDEKTSGATFLTFRGEASDDAPPFTSASFGISSRPLTTSFVTWEPPPWNITGAAGPGQLTPDLAAVIQEVVDRPGWQLGNSLALVIAGTGERVAESFNGDPSGAPLLHIEYNADQLPPTVEAGDDQAIVLPDLALLDGTATDDGLPDPPGDLALTWSVESGPGPVTFGDPSAEDTTASFTAPGAYVLRLTAFDGEITVHDELVVTVTGANGETVLEVRVAKSTDDAEERESGTVSLTSSDMELVYDKGGNQLVGLRFDGLSIPAGSTIQDAWIQFQVDETNSIPTSLAIEGQAADDAATFASVAGSLSVRPRTTSFVLWSPAPWTTVGAAGPDQRTPSLVAVLQEIVSRPGWSPGNAAVFFITGTGERAAESFNGDQAAAPLLHVVYQ